MTTTPANGTPAIPTIQEFQPWPGLTTPPATAPKTTQSFSLTQTQKILVGTVAAGAVLIAGIGFAGSYAAVRELALGKGFGDFATWLPLGIDAGIIVFLALDLLLTWLRIPFPLLRQTAWLLTAATIAFNGAASWPDAIGVAMHAVIPVLFVIAVEAARHAVGRIADITADKHIENPPLIRWFVAPLSTLLIWRRMRKWHIRSYDDAIRHQREVKIYRARMRKNHGRSWRRKAPADKLLVLTLASYGLSIVEAIEMPEVEARKRNELEAKLKSEAKQAELNQKLAEAETEAKRRTELARAAAAETEAKRVAEVKRAETEAKLKSEALRGAEEARVLKAETEAKLAEIARKERQAEAEAEANRLQREADAARRERERRTQEDRDRREKEAREEADRRKAEAAEKAKRITSETLRVPTPATPEPETGDTPKPKRVTGPNPKPANLGGRRSKRITEIETVLARITEVEDPEAVSLKWVEQHFGLKTTTAWDRLTTAREMWAEAKKSETAKSA